MTARERWLVAGVWLTSGGFSAVVRLVAQGAASPGPERTGRLLLALPEAVERVVSAIDRSAVPG